ncbi:MAG: ABC transporter ATP-binding protein [Clostridiaceae bacterium]|jgi:ABC-type multidrug transport system fused ATPase/permease subunit|nr:ABC transporter ATP-binding protein [Clostridiaceae bacterium]
MKIHSRKAAGNGLLVLMGMCGYLAVLMIVGNRVSAGTVTFGELTAVFQYRGGLMKGMMMLINSLMNIKTAMAGVKRVNETMSMSLEE